MNRKKIRNYSPRKNRMILPDLQEFKKLKFENLIPLSGLLLGLSTGIAYLIISAFQVGYFYHFNIPLMFISYEIPLIIGVMSLIFMFIFMILFYVPPLIFFLSEFFNINKMDMISWFLYFSFNLLLLILYWDRWKFFLGIIIGEILIFIFANISNWYVGRIFIGRAGIPVSELKTQKKFRLPGSLLLSKLYYMDLLKKYYGIKLISIIGAFFYICFFAYGLGKFEAMISANYYTINTKPECVILHTFGKNVLCSPFNRENKEVIPIFRVIDLSNINNQSVYQLSYEHIGQLHIKPSPTPTLVPTLTPTITITPLPTETPKPTENPE